MNRPWVRDFVARFLRCLWPLGVLFCLSCSEHTGPPPAEGFSNAPADYSTPPERIAEVFALPDIDLNQPLEQEGPLDFGERVCIAGKLIKFTGCVIRREGEMHYPPRVALQHDAAGQDRILSSVNAKWTNFDRATLRHDYELELPTPPTPGRYLILFTTSRVNMQTHESTRVDLARLRLISKRQP